MGSKKHKGDDQPVEVASGLKRGLGADYAVIHEALSVFTRHTDIYNPAMEALEQIRTERDRYRDALLMWKRMMADPNYDFGELCEEFTKMVNGAFGIST